MQETIVGGVQETMYCRFHMCTCVLHIIPGHGEEASALETGLVETGGECISCVATVRGLQSSLAERPYTAENRDSLSCWQLGKAQA